MRIDPSPETDWNRILTSFGRVGLGFSAGTVRIVISRDCQLKYAMSYV